MKKEVSSSTDGAYGIVSFVLGIVSIVLSFLIPLLGFIMGIVGIVFAVMQRKRGKTRLSHAGMILNIIGIVLAVVFFVATYLFFKNNPELLAQLQAGSIQ